MFGECQNLTEIKGIETFDTSSSGNFAAMFQSDRKIKEIDCSSFDTSNTSFLHYMFAGCDSLERIIGIENFNTSKNRTFRNMFASCRKLKEVDISSFDTSSSDDFASMFDGCGKLKTIYASKAFENISTAESTNMFAWCLQLVGGSGTKYDPTFIDSTAARIDGGINSPGYFTSISDKPLETTQTNESYMSETTGNEVRNV